MIDFEIPEETRLLVDTVRRFVEIEVQPLEEEMEAKECLPPGVLAGVKAKAVELGLFAMNMPAEVGGGGLSAVDMCLVEEQLGKTSEALIRGIFGQVYEMLAACKDVSSARNISILRSAANGSARSGSPNPRRAPTRPASAPPRSGTATTTSSTGPSTSSATATSPISRSSWP